MLLPEHPYKPPLQSASQTTFGGICRTQGAKGGDVIGGENLSSQNAPALSPRPAMTPVSPYLAPTALYGWDKLVVVDDGNLYYDGTLLTSVTPGEKQFAVVGQTLVVWPDKITVNLANRNVTTMEAAYTTASAATFTTTTIQAEPIPAMEEKEGRYRMSATTPYIRKYTSLTFTNGAWTGVGGENIFLCNLAVGDLFILYETEAGDFQPNVNWTSGSYHIGSTYRYPENTKGMYGEVTAITESDWEQTIDGTFGSFYFTYTLRNITVTNRPWSNVFAVGDAVTVTGCTAHRGNNNKVSIITGINATTNTLTFGANTFGGSGDTWTDGPITVTRAIPPLDFICEKDNRLWGVSNSSKTIFASGLGAPMAFYDFDNLSTDSYAVALGGPGEFTGICNYSGNVLAFKEHSLSRIAGDYPSQYTLYTDTVEGVAKGSHHSLSIVNEVLYYHGVTGVYSYTGSQPNLISYPLGNKLGKNAVAGTNGKDYFLSWEIDDGWELLVYDTFTGQWNPWTPNQCHGMAQAEGSMYIATGSEVTTFGGTTESVAWSCTLFPYDEGTLDYKQYHTIAIHGTLESGEISLAVIWDDGSTKTMITHSTPGSFVKACYIPFRRTRTLGLTLTGTGPCQIHRITRKFLPYD